MVIVKRTLFNGELVYMAMDCIIERAANLLASISIIDGPEEDKLLNDLPVRKGFGNTISQAIENCN